jgi:hypothetical protein
MVLNLDIWYGVVDFIIPQISLLVFAFKFIKFEKEKKMKWSLSNGDRIRNNLFSLL